MLFNQATIFARENLLNKFAVNISEQTRTKILPFRKTPFPIFFMICQIERQKSTHTQKSTITINRSQNYPILTKSTPTNSTKTQTEIRCGALSRIEGSSMPKP
ncbi:hypothetical protein Droror1_Dr00025804 [Drosera rotundifolia]